MVEFAPASTGARGDPSGEEADGGISVEKREKYSAICKWLIPSFSKLKQRTTRCLWSKYFEVGGYDCRLLVYPAGDSQALPGYISIYLQVTDPKNATGKWDCFASYRLCVANQQGDDSKSISRDSWHRFSAKRKSHGWCDFAQSSVVLDAGSGFAISDTILVTADILVLSEQTMFVRDNELALSGATSASTEVLSGKFTWKVRNFGLFQEMIKTQKIMSPAFSAGECSLRLSVYQSAVNGSDYLSMCLESKDTDKSGGTERSCWCLFRMSVLGQIQGGRHMHRDSYGRFAADSKTGDNTSLGWNDFMSMPAFTEPSAGYFVDDTAIFSASFHIIKESSTFARSTEKGAPPKSRARLKAGAGDAFQGKFTWKIEHFTRLKELLKKRKITGLCIKSRRFQVGSRDCRLIVYPRGQSQPPNHLSMFLEVTDPASSLPDWSCFVSHRLSVVNQRSEDKSVAKESQNRYSKQAKDWGWREFVTLTSLFDLDAGFLVNDCVVFAAEVLVLRETSELKALPSSKRQQLLENGPVVGNSDEVRPKLRFSWRIENFVAFKEIMETRKIFSKYFTVEGCDLRIGVYESFDTLCIYLESDAFGSGLERNFWVKYRIAIVNQKFPQRTEWKESSICTKTWNNSVLQFMKVTEMVDQEAGYVQRDGLLLACEVLDCQPWFDFADLEVLASDSEAESLSTDPDELLDSDESDMLTAEEEDTFRSLLGDAGLHLVDPECKSGLDARDLQQVLSEKMEMNMDAALSFIAGLRIYLADDAFKVKRLLQSGHGGPDNNEPGVCLLDLLMGIEALQQPLMDLLLDTLLQLCHHQPRPKPSGGRAKRQAFPGSPGPTASSLSAAHSRFSLDGREDGECASSSSAALPSLEGAAAAKFGLPALTGTESCSSGTATPQEASGQGSAEAGSPEGGKPPSDAAAAGEEAPPPVRNGTRPPGGREKVDELILLALHWLSTICPQGVEGSSCPSSGIVPKVQALLSDLPRHLQPQLVLVIPNVIDTPGHTSIAGILLAHLAEASQESLQAERELRLPVLCALGRLHINPAVAEKVLQTALEALALLSEAELPPAIGLMLKLAEETGSCRDAAVHAVRSRLKGRPEIAAGSLDAVRLALSQHPEVAAALLADIDADCRATKSAAPMEGDGRDSSGNSPVILHAADLEVLLDLLGHPKLVEKARAVFERATARGLLNDMEVAILLEQRRMRALASSTRSQAEQFLSSLEMGAAFGGESLSLPPREPPPVDDSEAVLGLAEVLAASKNQKARAFAASLYQTLLRVNTEENKRGRMLRGLVSRAAAGSALQQAQGKDQASGQQPSSRTAQNGKSSSHVPRSPRAQLGGPKDAHSGAGMAPEGRQEMDVTTPEGLLLTLISQQGGVARPAVVLMMLEAQAAHAKATALGKRVSDLEGGQEKSQKDAKSAAQKQKQEAQQLSERLAASEAQVAQLRSDHSTEAAGFAEIKRELEEKVRNLERELEWVRGEREEERGAMAHERRETAARLKEAETASNRLKSARRDDLKRVTRERAQAVERCRELESAHAKLEEEARRLRGAAADSAATQDSLANRLKEQEQSAIASRSQHEEQAAKWGKRVRELEGSLKEREAYASNIEAQLQEEVARTAPLLGQHLDRLSAAQLDSLARIHERGLKQARAIMIQKRSEESAAATAVAAANAVTGGPPLRQSRGSPIPAAAVAHRSGSSVGSLDSLVSMGFDPPITAARGLAPSQRAPGAAQLPAAEMQERSGIDFNGQGLQRSVTPGTASYYSSMSSSQPGSFSQTNATLPNGFPNGLLSGTGLLNGKQSSGNGIHRLW